MSWLLEGRKRRQQVMKMVVFMLKAGRDMCATARLQGSAQLYCANGTPSSAADINESGPGAWAECFRQSPAVALCANAGGAVRAAYRNKQNYPSAFARRHLLLHLFNIECVFAIRRRKRQRCASTLVSKYRKLIARESGQCRSSSQ